jgi:protein-L-isoaspartate(D-aspartate) O-methyltransferase
MAEPAEARRAMVQHQLRDRDIADERVLEAMGRVPRELFVPEEERRRAYADAALPIGHGQTISQPYMVARIAEALSLRPGELVLDVGTGSGYQAAVLSRLARQVLTVERYRKLAETAGARLERLGCHNVEVMLGDGLDLPANIGPFDRIIVTAAMERIPENLVERLDAGGVLIAPVGPHQGVQTLVRLTRGEAGTERKELVDVRFVPALPGVAREL